MVFSSLVFLYAFLPLCLAAYFLVRDLRWKNGVLLLFSLVFYAWGEPIWVLLLLASSAVDYLNGLFIKKHRQKPIAKLGVVFSLVFNLGVLVLFKYSGLLVSTLNTLTGLALAVPSYHLPIGISFYSFQTISYVIDVYRDDTPAQTSFFKFTMFVSLFHQLVAGPIVRYRDIAAEIEGRKFSWTDFSGGVMRLSVGLAKKVLLANTCGQVVKEMFGSGAAGLSVAGSWWGILFFAFQIYFDFSGYSDMAIGLGRLFGFHYRENFDYPYTALSATDFWRRWHMSLGTFFRDYLYIPLGGNKKHMVFNLIVVWFLTGLWHGASWNFVVWGLFYGLLILTEKILAARVGFKLPVLIKRLYFIGITLIGWTFFYYENLRTALIQLRRMFGFGGVPLTDTVWELSLRSHVFFLPLCILACLPLKQAFKKILSPFWNALGPGGASSPGNSRARLLWHGTGRPALAILLTAVSTVLLMGKTYNPFLYFRF